MRRRLRFNNTNLINMAMLGVVVMASGFLLTFFLNSKSTTQALSATEFQAGRIIDDSIFYNPNTMTAAEIDAFIDSHSPTCDMWGTQKAYDNVTRAEYVKQLRAQGYTKYHDPPFVCVSEYYENPETHKTNFETGGKKEAGMLSAGEIIYKAAQEYSINPQVLLVMLKKESYVWGDDWPHSFQYNTVMGYACPDGAPCDSKYFGFYNQVMMAAWQLNYYREHIYSYNYRPYTTNNILYNPDRSCGTKSVYLENIATTSLYIYTPYVPNEGALANYPGTSYCGSYGNRNFYMYFGEWFGDTIISKAGEIEKALDNHAEQIGFGKAKNNVSCSRNGDKYYCNKQYTVGYIFYNNGEYKLLFGDSLNIWSKTTFLDYPISDEIYTQTGYAQKFKNGAISWTSENGAKFIFGDIYKEWLRSGAENGTLGLALSGEDYSTKGYAIQKFERGVVYYNTSNGKISILGNEIAGTWESIGMDKSFLGQPTANMSCPRNNACVQSFKNSAISWTSENGAKFIFGDIYKEWIKSGAENGSLGLAISNEDYSTKGYATQRFERGVVYYNTSNGKISILGNVMVDTWEAIGMDKSFLGQPTASMSCPTSDACVQKFRSGAISWTSENGAKFIFGDIYKEWLRSGAENGTLGLALSGEDYSTKGYAIQKFERGVVYYNTSNGKISILGNIMASTWQAIGMEKSFLGQPTASMSCPSSDACVQKFKNGAISWTSENDTKFIFGDIYKEWIKSGAENGSLGLAISNEDYSTKGYAIQKFERGVIYYNTSNGKISIESN